ncbi:MAG: aminoglycoside phosphotransferase family protein [Polyangiales bacterium]
MGRSFSEESCAADFGLGRPKAEFTLAGRGQMNPLGVLRLETDRGTFAIKQSLYPPRPVALRIERMAHEAGLTMPTPILTVEGRSSARYAVDTKRVWVRAFGWVDGEAGAWGSVSERASFEVAGVIGRVQQLPLMAFMLEDKPHRPLHERHWRKLARSARERHKPWARLLDERIDLLVEAEAHADREAHYPQCVSHRDYHPPNFIEPKSGPRALVDWDSAGTASPRLEALRFALIWATPEVGPPQRDLVRAFVRGYEASGLQLPAPTLDEMIAQAQPRVRRIRFNVLRGLRNEVEVEPGLVEALLQTVAPLDHDELESLRGFFA